MQQDAKWCQSSWDREKRVCKREGEVEGVESARSTERCAVVWLLNGIRELYTILLPFFLSPSLISFYISLCMGWEYIVIVWTCLRGVVCCAAEGCFFSITLTNAEIPSMQRTLQTNFNLYSKKNERFWNIWFVIALSTILSCQCEFAVSFLDDVKGSRHLQTLINSRHLCLQIFFPFWNM